jgi:hypothetical protein
MRKNRIIISIWLSVIALIILAMIFYIIYAAINNPYFGKTETAVIRNILFYI